VTHNESFHPRLFLRAAVAGYACFPGTRSFYAPPSQAMPASPASPPKERIHSWYGKPKAAKSGPLVVQRAAGGADKTIGRHQPVMVLSVRPARQKSLNQSSR